MHSHYMVLRMKELKITEVGVASSSMLFNPTFTKTVLLLSMTLMSITEPGYTSMDIYIQFTNRAMTET